MAPVDLVIFDCDGVLVDSEKIACEIDTELLLEAGVTITATEMAERYAGMAFAEILKEIEREHNIPLSASMIEQSDQLLDKALATVPVIPGAREAVMAVRGPRCVCSNSPRSRLEISLGATNMLDLFEPHLYAAHEVGTQKPKPAPDVFEHAAKQFRAQPRRTFVIEDSVHGVAGAVAAGMRVIGFTGGGHSTPGHTERLMDAGAETVIDRFDDLHAMIDALAGFDMPV